MNGMKEQRYFCIRSLDRIGLSNIGKLEGEGMQSASSEKQEADIRPRVVNLRTTSDRFGGLDQHSFIILLSCQLNVQDTHTFPANDLEHRVVPIAVYGRVDRNNPDLANQRGEFIFDAGADAGIPVKVELAILIEYQRKSQVDEILF